MLPSVRQEPSRGYRRLFLFLIAALFYPLLRIFWPVVTTQDYLPWLPLLPIFAVPGCTWARDVAGKEVQREGFVAARSLPDCRDHPRVANHPQRFGGGCCRDEAPDFVAVLLPIYLVGAFFWLRERRQSPLSAKVAWLLLPSLLLAGEIAYIVTDEPLSARPNQRRIGHLAQLLRLIDPGEYVLDTKGETIYRPRPTRLVLETLTINQIKSGHIQDDIVPRLIATRTALVHSSSRMTPAAQDFIDKNYVHVDGGRVLGTNLPTPKNKPVPFDIIIPERYGFVTMYGAATGTLDGRPIDGPRWLEPGHHQIVFCGCRRADHHYLGARAGTRFSPHIDSDAKAND